ncbi:MAG: N-acetylmuramoyl-L-alanine amidase [Methylococcales bacterium]|nr:N-acetylmuramoyl-L-alanine amidase [Methylococcales bacterium]
MLSQWAFALTVALDVGHSLANPGAASARGMPEFQFNLTLANAVKPILERKGFAVQIIGGKGDMTDLRARTLAAKNADFFLSLHHDSVQPQYLSWWSPKGKRQAYSDLFSGFSLFVSRANPHPETSLFCASGIGERLRYKGFKPTGHHADSVRGENRQFADWLNGVYYFDDLLVLKTAYQPAVLLESGIIVNRADELKLLDAAIRNNIAEALGDALNKCLQPASGK